MTAKKRTAQRSAPRATYARSSSAPFSEEQAPIVGKALKAIADAHRVNDVRSLDERIVYASIQADDHHPLRQFLNWDNGVAADQFRIQQCKMLITGIRVVTMELPEREIHKPMFIAASAPTERGTTKRARVLRADSLRNDAVFMSALGGQIRRVIGAFRSLETYAADGQTPKDVLAFIASLKRAIDTHLSNVSDAAE
jgi:hypothetical protein